MKINYISAVLVLLALLILPVTNLLASSQPYTSSHRINFGSGNKYYVETDLNITGPGASLAFKRTYNSQSTTTGALGYGWTSTFGEHLLFDTTKIILVQSGGRYVHFTDNGSGAWVNESGKTRTLIVISGGYQLTESNGTIFKFDTNGFLLEKRTLSNYTLSFTRTGTLLSIVTDSFGRSLSFSYDANNRLQTLTSPIGTISYHYDINGNLETVTQPDTTIRTYIYNDPSDIHNLTGIIDETGTRTLTVAYDVNDRAVSSFFAGGKESVTIEYLPSLLRKITNSLGVVSTYQLEVKNGIIRVASFTGPGCSACGSDTGSAYVYGARQLITQVTDAKGTITSYTYDVQGNRNSKTEAVGTSEERITNWTYEVGSSRIATITKNSVANPGLQNVTSMTYDVGGNMTGKTESGYSGNSPINRTSSYIYDVYGRITSIDGPRTDMPDTTTFIYYPNDPAEGLNRGNLKTVTNALGHTTTYNQYNTFGKAELITPPYGSPITMTYDAMGRLSSKTRGSISTTYQYYADGKIHIIQLPDARTISYTYTASGKPETISDSLNNKIIYTYDIQDNRIKQEIHDPDNALQHFVEYTYEETGELDKIIRADTSFEDMNYDSVGNLVKRINALNKTTEYRYDALNRLTAMVAPGAVTTGYNYDSNDNLTTVTDAEGKQTVFIYDDFGRRTSRMSPDTGLTIYAYDQAANLVSQTDSNSISTTYNYDALNRLTAVHYPDSTQDVLYTYDGNGYTGLLTSMQDSAGTTTYQYDEYGRLVSKFRNQGGKLFNVAYGYNDNGELSSITYPSGRIITYYRNTADQVTSVTSTFQGITTTGRQFSVSIHPVTPAGTGEGNPPCVFSCAGSFCRDLGF